MKQPFTVIFNNSEVKVSFYPEGDLCLTVDGKSYQLSRDQTEILRTVLNEISQEKP